MDCRRICCRKERDDIGGRRLLKRISWNLFLETWFKWKKGETVEDQHYAGCMISYRGKAGEALSSENGNALDFIETGRRIIGKP
ncbi:hypothetical protein IFM89_013122 [Coptis chinensis]|uniref:Uncharacterized protein n=1 Tax=Coptis chinensis TaxID=261450 RepID=A0A835IMF3_9MAGN|nr:hypothetical protein IFM89_013122 [Coptis chinensis]